MGTLAAEFSQCFMSTTVVDKESDCGTIHGLKQLRQIRVAVMEQGGSG